MDERIEEYEDLLEVVELIRAIAEADHEIEAGRGIPHDEVMAELAEKYAVR